MSDILPRDFFKDWTTGDLVCLDVDSTVCKTESLNEYAKRLGKLEEIEALTKAAMDGQMEFAHSLRNRLEVLQPTISTYTEYVKFVEKEMYAGRLLSDGVGDFIRSLRRNGVHVMLVSGGFYEIISKVAKFIGLPVESFTPYKSTNTLCGAAAPLPPTLAVNRLKFYCDGSYAGIDERCPTSKGGPKHYGKGIVVEEMTQKFNFNRVAMIGDGMTDLEVKLHAKAINLTAETKFIAYTEYVQRDAVIAGADYEMKNFADYN